MAAAHSEREMVLELAGLDPRAPMVRVASNANEVWLGEHVAVRINHPRLPGAAPDRLLREARIAARLPRAARYPEIVSAGRSGDLAWLITRRAPGVQLGSVWHSLSPGDREQAIHQLVEALGAVHTTPLAGIDDDIAPPHTLPRDAILELIGRLDEDQRLLDEVAGFVRERWSVVEGAPRVLVHGDPHLENVLWSNGEVTALLDMEWSRPSLHECDLETLLSVADHPASFAAEAHEGLVLAADYAAVPRWIAVARPDWFSHPQLVERLELLHVSRTLGCLADAPGSAIRLAHLRAVLAGTSPFRALS